MPQLIDDSNPMFQGVKALWNLIYDYSINQRTGEFHDEDHSTTDYSIPSLVIDQLYDIHKYVENNEEYNKFAWLTADFPVVGWMTKLIDNVGWIKDYMENTGIDWSDMKYPTHVRGAGSGVYGTMNFVSSNIARLYR